MPSPSTARARLPWYAPALAALFLAGCPGDSTGPTERPGINVLSGAGIADTVTHVPASPLRVRVRGSDGAPLAGVRVEFRAEPAGSVYLLAGGPPREDFAATTDKDGLASVQIGFGVRAGPAAVVIAAPAAGAVDTATYTVLPGGAARVLGAPSDSTVYVGASYPLRGVVMDRFDNPRTDRVTFSAVSGPVTVAGEAVRGQAIGRGRVAARAGRLADTMDVSVVPTGVLAVRTNRGINGTATDVIVVQVDGSQARTIAPPGEYRVFEPAQGLGWAPGGGDVLLAQGEGLSLVNAATAARRVVVQRASHGARFSRDGQWIYFSANGTLFRVRPDGSGIENVNPPDDTPFNRAFNHSPSPSPDGRYLAYVADPGHVSRQTFVRVYDLATRTRRPTSLAGTNVAWAPSGDVLVYADDDYRLHLVRSDGSAIRALGRYEGRVAWFDWSPDGRWIVTAAVWGPPVTLIESATGMQLPLGWAASDGDAAWRP